MHGRTETDLGGAIAGERGFAPFDLVDGDLQQGLLIICDHASNHIPAEYDTLGLGDDQLSRHIAYDIGVEDVTRRLADALNAPAVLSRFSRLLIDPNRGLDDPTLVMRLSDGAVVPGNAHIDQAEIDLRITNFYRPYDDAVGQAIERFIAAGIVPAILSIHSFTASWRGNDRPWHAGVLWDSDPRFAIPLMRALEAEGDLVVGNNEPYSGELEGDMMNRHGTQRGLAHALLEIRQDLISDSAGTQEWAGRLARIVPALVADDTLHHLLDDAAQ